MIGSAKKQSGFTLLEIVIALAILGMGVSFILTSDRVSWSSARGSVKMLKAGQMIEKNIEDLRVYISLDPDNHYPPTDTTFSENGISFSRIISTANSPKTGAALTNVKKMEIKTGWGTAVNDSLNISTYIAREF